MVGKDRIAAVTQESDRRGGAAVAAVVLPELRPAEVDKSRPPVLSAALWWNTGVQFIMNPTLGTLRVLNQETGDSIDVASAGSGLVTWFLPWCNTYDEVTNKSLVFR